MKNSVGQPWLCSQSVYKLALGIYGLLSIDLNWLVNEIFSRSVMTLHSIFVYIGTCHI